MWHSSGCSLRTEDAAIIERGADRLGPGSLLFVHLLRIGRVLDELVVAPSAFVASSCTD
jgi:hypothetical protein